MGYDSLPEEERAALDAALSRLSLDLEKGKRKLLLEYLHLLEQKNEYLNLTRIVSLEDAVVLHLEDALAVYGEFSKHEGRFCDLGTGGGVPGIPLAIASGKSGVLLDSVKKKARAVQGFIDELGLSGRLESKGERSEDLAAREPESFDIVIARAVSSFAAVEELAAPLLKRGGILVAMRGTESPESLSRARRAAPLLGLSFEDSREYAIGQSGEFQRSVYTLVKEGKPSVPLPRRAGVAQKRPLGD